MSNYFHTDDPTMISWLTNVMARCQKENLSLRLKVDSSNSLLVKVGGGIWTHPIESTFDLSRDIS